MSVTKPCADPAWRDADQSRADVDGEGSVSPVTASSDEAESDGDGGMVDRLECGSDCKQGNLGKDEVSRQTRVP